MENKTMPKATFDSPSYGLVRNVGKSTIEAARPAVESALKDQGFGVLTEIDVRKTLHKKIGVDFRPYLILGACSPQLAYEALQAELPIGLLLPCNVVMTEEANGDLIVSAVDPTEMFKVVGREDIAPMAEQVKAKLSAFLEGIRL